MIKVVIILSAQRSNNKLTEPAILGTTDRLERQLASKVKCEDIPEGIRRVLEKRQYQKLGITTESNLKNKQLRTFERFDFVSF
jgi:hypothetical protein